MASNVRALFFSSFRPPISIEHSVDSETFKEPHSSMIGEEISSFGSFDVFWEQVQAYDRPFFFSPEKEDLFLYAAACECWDDFFHFDCIPRICIEEHEYPYNSLRFLSNSSGCLQGWQHWTDEILAWKCDYMDILKIGLKFFIAFNYAGTFPANRTVMLLPC